MSRQCSGSTDQVLAELRNRNDKERRGWSLREEHVLAEALEKIVQEGWRSENGFKTGYLGLLHGYMKQVFPNTDIKPETHITSRLTVWKKNYHSLFEILKHTGVGLDSTTKMVEATDEQCEGFVKKNSIAHLMRHKSWPLYDDECEIFGITRATGLGTEDHLNALTPPLSFSVNVGTENDSTKVQDEK
ncbi:hypothetical protein ACS0TY_017136 [Phlomoides rotata]